MENRKIEWWDEMEGLDQFLKIFGNLTIETLVVLILAITFCYKGYKQFSKFLENKKELAIQKYEAEKEKDKQLKIALEEVAKYPQYREQSKRIQQSFREEIDGLKIAQENLSEKQEEIRQTLLDMKNTIDKRERNKLRDRLLQMYRYYTNEKTNPNCTITRMEHEVFWELFGDYEEAGGDGYMHTVVQPEMNKLDIVD